MTEISCCKQPFKFVKRFIYRSYDRSAAGAIIAPYGLGRNKFYTSCTKMFYLSVFAAFIIRMLLDCRKLGKVDSSYFTNQKTNPLSYFKT